jgi:hypothetical protein
MPSVVEDGVDGVIEDVDRGGGRFRVIDPPVDRGHPAAVRSWIAYFLLLLISTLSVALIAGIWLGRIEIDAAKDLATSLIAPLFAVFGAVVGFYFGGTASGR